MTDEPETPSLQNLWQDQPTEISPMLLADVHSRALKYERRLNRGMTLRYSEMVAALIMMGFMIFRASDGLTRIGVFLLALGALFGLYISHSGSLKFRNADAVGAASRACFDFYKQSLELRIKYVSTAWAWYLTPLVPGLAVLLYQKHQAQHSLRVPVTLQQAIHTVYGFEALIVLMFTACMVYWQLRARKLRQELAALEA